MNRKEFFRMSVGFIGGLSLHCGLGNAATIMENQSPRGIGVDELYLKKGLNALARAHRMSAMAGHLGASLVSGFFIGKQRPIPGREILNGIEGDLNRVMAGESVFGARMKNNSELQDSELFEDFPKEKPDESLIDGIAEALEKNIRAPRASGHNVIFASIAIRALKEYPEYATPSIIDGIRRLISLFDNSDPGSGYYGSEKGRIRGNKVILPEVDDGAPEYRDVNGMVEAVLGEIANQDLRIVRQGYGGLVHVNNHAAAIVDLANSGYTELVPAAVLSHNRHLRLWRNLPDIADESGPQRSSEFNPFTSDYWVPGRIPYDRALLTHRVKTMFGFNGLTEAVDHELLEKRAYDKLQYMM